MPVIEDAILDQTPLDTRLPTIATYLDDSSLVRVGSAPERVGHFDVANPATGELLGTVADLGRVETARAIAAADGALGAWQDMGVGRRGAILSAWRLRLPINSS